jgi:hypothetical protein
MWTSTVAALVLFFCMNLILRSPRSESPESINLPTPILENDLPEKSIKKDTIQILQDSNLTTH